MADTVKTVSLLRDAQNATPSLQAINDSGVFEALESTSGALKVIMDAITDVKITLADGLTELPVKFLTAQEVANASGVPIETVLQYTFGASKAEWKPRVGEAVIAIGESNSDLQTGYGLALQKVFIPATFTGTAIAIHITDASDGTPAALYTDASVAVSIPVSATNKGKWVAMDIFSGACQGMMYFRFASNDTEAAARSISYILG